MASNGMNDATRIEAKTPYTSHRTSPTKDRAALNSSSASSYYYQSNADLYSHQPLTLVVAPDAARTGLELELLKAREATNSLQLEVAHLSTQVSRERDDREVMQCKVLRVEGSYKALSEEVAEAQHSLRKVRSEADHYKRAHQEATNLKAQLAASRDELQTQVNESQSANEALRQRCKAVEENRNTVADMYDALRERNASLDTTNAEAQIKLSSLELQVLTATEEARLQGVSHQTFRQELSAETERLAAYFKAITAQFEDAMDYERRAAKNPSNSHMLPPYHYEDDLLTPHTELLIFENAKRSPLTVPLYTNLHSALRELSLKHKAFRRDYLERGTAIAKATVLTDDLNNALQDNTILANRIAKMEAQVDAAGNQSKILEKDLAASRGHLATLLSNLFAKFDGPMATIPSHDSVAVLSLCETANGLASKVAHELSAYRQGKTDLQAQVTRLLSELEDQRQAHQAELDALKASHKQEVAIASHTMKLITEEACEARASQRQRDKDLLIADITGQLEALLKANEQLKFDSAEARRQISNSEGRAMLAEQREKDIRDLLAEEQKGHQTAKMNAFVLQERVLVAEQETNAAKALRLVATTVVGSTTAGTNTSVYEAAPRNPSDRCHLRVSASRPSGPRWRAARCRGRCHCCQSYFTSIGIFPPLWPLLSPSTRAFIVAKVQGCGDCSACLP